MSPPLPTDPKPGNLSVVVRVWTIVAAIGLSAFACGPSVSSIYEGNIRFEHCYRLDLDPSIAPSHREACWREWASRYTYGQTRDRLDYSRRRIAQLVAGDTSRLSLDLDAPAAHPAPSATEAVAPISPRKPPPPTITTMAPRGSEAAPPPRPPQPENRCVKQCAEVLNTCKRKCPVRPDAQDVPCEPCAGDYRTCMRRCFE